MMGQLITYHPVARRNIVGGSSIAKGEISVKMAMTLAAWIEVKCLEAAMDNETLLAIEDVVLTGSHRRNIPSTHDVDILIVAEASEGDVTAELEKMLRRDGDRYVRTIERGKQKFVFVMRPDGEEEEVEVDLRVCKVEERGAMLLHTTGPTDFNVLLRKRAKTLGMTLSEHGLFSTELVHSATEEGILKALGLSGYIPPDQRSPSALQRILRQSPVFSDPVSA